MKQIATIGQALTTPETGWQRFDDTNSNITYVGTWSVNTINGSYLNNTSKYTRVVGDKIRFNFIGSNIRIVSYRNSAYSGNVTIKIDNITYNYSQNGSTLAFCLLFEKTGLVNKEHFVEIIMNDTTYLDFDAIDIDLAGQLKPYNPMVCKYLIQQGTLYTYNGSNIVQSPLQELNSNNFKENGFNDPLIITEEEWNSTFPDKIGLQLLMWTDDVNVTQSNITCNIEPHKLLDKLNNQFEIRMMKAK